MVLPRASAFGRIFGSSASRTARIRSPGYTWRTAGRRTYASDHGPAKKSSDLPWMIGSIAITVPSAAWLLQQGPKKGDHGHEHEAHDKLEDHKEQHEEDEVEPKDQGGDEEGKGEGEEQPKDETEAKSEDEGKDDSEKKEEGSDSESGDDKDTPDTSDDEGASGDQVPKGKGEKQKGTTRPRTETKEEKMMAKDVTTASNPYLADLEKSKKGEGVVESGQIHGAVDIGRKVRGPSDRDMPKDVEETKAKDRPTAVQA